MYDGFLLLFIIFGFERRDFWFVFVRKRKVRMQRRQNPSHQPETPQKKTEPVPKTPTEADLADYLVSHQALKQVEIVEINAVQKKNPKLHYDSEQNVINLLVLVGCLSWIALKTRPDIAWATSRAASLIIHDPDTCLGDASFAPTGKKSQQGLIVYHGITSETKNGGNLVQWRSS